MYIADFIAAYKAKTFIKTEHGVEEKMNWLCDTLKIKKYISFRDKREIAEMIAEQNISEVDGVKKYDKIDGYISLIVASIAAHTILEFSDDPVADYDLLAESGLLMDIIAMFEGSHSEIDMLLHMVVDMEMEDNETSAIIGRFLNRISKMLDGIVDTAKNKIKDMNVNDIFGGDLKEEDVTKLLGFLNKLK